MNQIESNRNKLNICFCSVPYASSYNIQCIYIYIYIYSFEGIEGTVQIATIAGSAGAFFDVTQGPFGGLQRFGFIVQSISVTSNMPLPTAP